ncbi:thiol reductant ABC exporter subunit CydD [Thiolinea disciformis]|uniref:thiol reductant ABC exporter subunit CydD n=1 Tax=Thiolinea disciformis TaxID=125614 RepID=UPI0003770A24|nr:thiol reductant ABC exporter subunit CydD [Thiolinea disciformis]
MTAPKPTSEPLASLNLWVRYAGQWPRIAVACGVLAGILLIAQAWLVAMVINGVLFERAHLDQWWPWLGGLLLIFVLRAVFNHLADQAAFQAASQVKIQLRQLLYAKVQNLGPAWLSEERSGAVTTTLSDGVEQLEAYYSRYLPAMRLSLYIPVMILLVVFTQDWLSGLVLLVTAPLIPLFMILIGKGTEKRNQQQWQSLSRLSAHFLDVIQGISTLHLFNASQREARAIVEVSEQYRQSTMSVLRVAFLSSFSLEFFVSVSIALVAVLVGFRLYWGELDFFAGFVVLLLAPEFFLPLRNLGTQYHARMQALAVVDSIQAILQAPEHQSQLDHPDWKGLAEQSIQFKQLSFQYPDGRQALRDFNLTIPPKKTLALVGASGAGKSTVLQILLGFIEPQNGEVLVGTSALQTISRKAWHSQIAWLPQRAQLFALSVVDNIRLGSQASLEAVKQAAKAAQADTFIERLPQGYDTLVGEAGQGLSGGQRQRLALARVFLKAAPLIILDEATAHLDANTETLIQDALEQLKGQHTIVMIAHRLKTIQSADCIAFLEQGRVLACGTHTELMRTCEPYHAMLAAYQQETV